MKTFSYVPFYEIELTDGFWKDRQKLNADVSIPNVYKRFKETNRIDCLYPKWKRPLSRSDRFYDSDTAKWIEAVAYVLQKHRADYPELEKLCDEVINLFKKRQQANGYLNSYFQRRPLKPKFFFRPDHELYCAGHIMEAAVAYYRATGKDSLLKASEKYADHI
ncbi:MAG: glycoside hydrolase family 127 protein, partial [Clostridia bacterium]|nr:glycoside hydrolase family 127 protein [Clostridia bacterium]